MGQRLLLVNILILIGIVALARYVTSAWHSYEEKENVATVLGPGKGKPKDVEVEAPPPPEPHQAFPNYTVIAEKDLFMPERRPAPPPEQEVKEVPPPMPKNPSLNGVLNNAGKKQALVTIWEGNNPKGSSKTLSVGDDIQGWTVSEIGDTTMKIRWKDQEKLIDMFDASPQQQPAVPPRNAQAAVTVITIGSPAAAVETSEASEAPASQRGGGMEVGVTGAQGGASGQRGPGQGGRGNTGNDSMRGGVGSSGTMGFPSGGGSNSVPFQSGTRRKPGGR